MSKSLIALFCVCLIPFSCVAQTSKAESEIIKKYAQASVDGIYLELLQADQSDLLLPVRPNHVFHSGDRVKLLLSNNFGGYLYVVSGVASGGAGILFPNSREKEYLIKPHQRYLVPVESNSFMAFAGPPGVESLRILISRSSIPFLEEAGRKRKGELAPSEWELIEKLWQESKRKKTPIKLKERVLPHTAKQQFAPSWATWEPVVLPTYDPIWDVKKRASLITVLRRNKPGKLGINDVALFGMELKSIGAPR
ncbi:MAG: DUF4384 domain-containing protein [Acidobacteria bacterium]|nr:DUF4384 domain-containing protein [Acidobacteriota bacterium]MBI3423212.1 DUF4384 domain-containing protein [Acidobacteriota bacterium]